MKECIICRKEFEPKRSNHVCCSLSCTQEREKLKKRERFGKDWTKTCEICGSTYKNKIHNSKTCNKVCAEIRRKRIRKSKKSQMQPPIEKVCDCGNKFQVVGYARSKMSCSDKCAYKRKRNVWRKWHHDNKVLKVRTCEFCSTTFNPTSAQRTCLSEECKKKLKRHYAKKYYKKPSAEKRRNYRNKNKDRINAWFREYNAERRKNPKHRISSRMYSAVRTELKKMVSKPSTTKTIQGLFTNEELYSHLESLFTDGMSWENINEWHIDHIRPIASFNYDSVDHPDFKKCWSLNNLQPLWAADNIAKGDKWDGITNA